MIGKRKSPIPGGSVGMGDHVVPPPLPPEPVAPPPTSGPEIFKLIVKLMPKLDPLGGVREVVELEDILAYFRTSTPPDFGIKAGLLLRRQVGGSYLVAQCFLSTTDTLSCDSFGRPYGRIFRTLRFDGALQDLFRHEDLIVFT